MAGLLVLLLVDALEEQHMSLDVHLGSGDLPHVRPDLRALHVEGPALFQLAQNAKTEIDVLGKHSLENTMRFCRVFTTIVPLIAAKTRASRVGGENFGSGAKASVVSAPCWRATVHRKALGRSPSARALSRRLAVGPLCFCRTDGSVTN